MEKNMQLTDLQKTYCLGMHPASFLGGKYPFLYVSTKISQFEKERFDRALDAVVRNNTLPVAYGNRVGGSRSRLAG